MSEPPHVVLVGGTARSGSTVLDLMLGGRAGAFSCGEVRAWFRPWRPYHLDPSCRCGRHPCPTWEQLRDLRAPRFHRGVVDRLDADTVVDSSKSLAWIVDSARWARRLDMEVSLALIWKDPHDLALSFHRRHPDAESVRTALRAFRGYYSMALSLGLPTVAVRNRDLRDHPAATVEALSAALRLAHAPGQARFWELEHHQLFGSDSAARQVAERRPMPDPEPTTDFASTWDRSGRERTADLDPLLAVLERADVHDGAGRMAPGSPAAPGLPSFTLRRYLQQRADDAFRTARLALDEPKAAAARVRRRAHRP